MRAVQPPTHQGQLIHDEWIGLVVKGADGATEHHQQVSSIDSAGVQRISSRIDILDRVAACLQQGFQRSQVFEIQVANGDGGLHDRGSSVSGFAGQ